MVILFMRCINGTIFVPPLYIYDLYIYIYIYIYIYPVIHKMLQSKCIFNTPNLGLDRHAKGNWANLE